MRKIDITCSKCGSTVFAGTLYCWKCQQQVKVGEYNAVEGQLVWTDKASGKPAAAFAIVEGADDAPVQVAIDKVRILGSRPVLLEMTRRDGGGNLAVEVEQIVRKAIDGEEVVHAKAAT